MILKCTGYEYNKSVLDLMEWDQVHANNVVRKNLAYVAEGVLDDVSGVGGRGAFGASVLQSVKFAAWALLNDLRQHVRADLIRLIILHFNLLTFLATRVRCCREVPKLTF